MAVRAFTWHKIVPITGFGWQNAAIDMINLHPDGASNNCQFYVEMVYINYSSGSYSKTIKSSYGCRVSGGVLGIISEQTAGPERFGNSASVIDSTFTSSGTTLFLWVRMDAGAENCNGRMFVTVYGAPGAS